MYLFPAAPYCRTVPFVQDRLNILCPNFRVASVSKRSDVNDRVPFEILLCLFIYIHTLCMQVLQLHKPDGTGIKQQ